MSTEHLCEGPDAGQLLGFLCSLGLLDAATRSLPDKSVRMGFRWHAVGWRPVLSVDAPLETDELVAVLHDWISRQVDVAEHNLLGDDLPCPVEAFVELAHEAAGAPDRATADRLAAFGVAHADDDRIEDTAFRTMSGAGHQHFIGFSRQIAATTTADQVRAALFSPWTYEDPGPSMRFDPADDRRYALRADNPSNASSSAPIRTVRGANALAVEGLRLLPVVPTTRGVATTLVDSSVRPPVVRWPLWGGPLSRDAAAGLLAHPRPAGAPGIQAVFECRRLTVGKFRGFTPARRVS